MQAIIRSFHSFAFLLILLGITVAGFELLSPKLILQLKTPAIGLVVITMIFAIYFARSKAFTLMIVPLFYLFYMFYPHILGLDGGFYSFWYMYPITLCIVFLLVGVLQERGLFCFYGLSKIVIAITALSISYYFIASFSAEFKQALDTSIISFEIKDILKINDFTFLISFLCMLFVGFISFLFFTGSVEHSHFWVLLALLCPAWFFETQAAFILFSIIASSLYLTALLKDAYKMAYIDTLTQIPARRALEEDFLKLGKKYTLAMVDIDHFKKFNDTYGHDIGDEVLKLVASILYDVKGGGKAYRYGGEEFTILFANKEYKETLQYLEATKDAIENRAFTFRDTKTRPKKPPQAKAKKKNAKSIHVTVSMGVASSSKTQTHPYDILKNADKALYKAKEAGRNCIRYY